MLSLVMLLLLMKTLVQIGCNIGNDDVYNLLKDSQHRFKVLLIDANYNSIQKCQESYGSLINRHAIDFLNVAIVDDCSKDNINIYVPTNDEKSPFCSVNENHVARHSHSDCQAINVEAVCINDLFDKYNIKDLDYLWIDTEGLCVDILLALNFDKYNIDKITFEYIHSDGLLSYGGPKLNSLYNKMKYYNYNGVKSGYNIICTKINENNN